MAEANAKANVPTIAVSAQAATARKARAATRPNRRNVRQNPNARSGAIASETRDRGANAATRRRALKAVRIARPAAAAVANPAPGRRRKRLRVPQPVARAESKRIYLCPSPRAMPRGRRLSRPARSKARAVAKSGAAAAVAGAVADPSAAIDQRAAARPKGRIWKAMTRQSHPSRRPRRSKWIASNRGQLPYVKRP